MCRRYSPEFGAAPLSASREVVAVSEPRQVFATQPYEAFPVAPINHAEAVAAHIRKASREMGELYLLVGAPSLGRVLQAGAASAEAMADFLDALTAGDAVTARGVLELFVTEAVQSGHVAV